MGRAAREASRFYSSERMAKSIQDTYQEVMAQKNG
jgi:hypothetical protein